MPKYVIEREISGVGMQSAEELRAAAQTSNDALSTLAPRVQWQQSFVTGDKVYCVYIADDEEVVREHARLSGFPCTAISTVAALIDPTTARGVNAPTEPDEHEREPVLSARRTYASGSQSVRALTLPPPSWWGSFCHAVWRASELARHDLAGRPLLTPCSLRFCRPMRSVSMN
jgi:hypothetical protein